tara:strand:- start:134 stop:631 length:498 start_codon:yes stop_codon:yes gene_type:complete
MVYVIENEGHQQVGATLNNLSVVKRPDGGITNNAKVDEQLHDDGGTVYHIREVVDTTSGSGPRRLNTAHPEYVKDKGWQRITKYGDALPEPADRQGTDDSKDTYDEDYGDNFGKYRQVAYEKEGVSIDAMIVALWEKEVEDRKDVADALEVKRQAVKKRFPKPSE